MSLLNSSGGSIPRSTPHLLADYIELEACFGSMPFISRAEIARLINEGRELGDEDLPEPAIDVSSAETNDMSSRYSEEVLRHLAYRASVFGKYYPFVSSGDLFKRRVRLTHKQRFYLLLLICSRLGVLSRGSGLRQRLAALFENVSAEVLRGLFPGMTVKRFGPGSRDRANYYGTALNKAFARLGKDLATKADVRYIADDNQGDRGIDIVGHVSWKDDANSVFAVFGQCAARGTEWPKKALEALPAVHRGVLNLRHDPFNVLFIPVCYREPNGEWVDPLFPWNVVLVDRVRIVQTFDAARSSVSPYVDAEYFKRLLAQSVA
ncbi:MAG TPA: hypothetical protein VGC72_03210 [Candidatus Elarobacter sp.]|jgi:hypothetical protein